MSREPPWLLHLSRRAVLAGTNISALARSRGDLRSAPELKHRFGLRSHEQRFVAELLRALPQLWVFRCDQLRSCGDFVLLDMSAAVALRRCAVLEHKQRKALRVSRHRQLENHARVVDELVRRRLLEPDAAVALLFGSANPRTLRSYAAPPCSPCSCSSRSRNGKKSTAPTASSSRRAR